MFKITTAQKLQLIAVSAAFATVGTAMQADAQGSHRTFNVKSFGAVGDGTTNDTTAIQATFTAAANTGATVVFPAGTYLINKGIVGSGVSVVGNNALLTTATNGIVLLALGGTSPSVSTMAFSSASGATNVGGLEMFSATNANTTNNSFGANLGQFGIAYLTVTGGTITANNLPTATKFGIATQSCSGLTITKNVVTQSGSNNGTAGIVDILGQNNEFAGNAVNWGTANNSFGIIIEGSTSPQLIKNVVVGGGVSIETDATTTGIVDHNVISGSVNTGILSTQDTTLTISNNNISNVSNDAIRINKSNGTNITTNQISNAGGNAVQSLAGGGNIAVTNNAIADCALTVTINAIIRVNNTAATTISVTGNQYKGNTANVTDFIHVTQTFATVSGNKTNSLLPTVVGP